MLKKNAQLRVEEKKEKKRGVRRTPYLRQPTAKSPRTKAQLRRVCVSTTVLRNQKKASEAKYRKVKIKKNLLYIL
jgi:hypothetical protein